MNAKQYEKLKPGTPVTYNRRNGEVIDGVIAQKWTPCGRNAYLLNYFQANGSKRMIDVHSMFIEVKQ